MESTVTHAWPLDVELGLLVMEVGLVVVVEVVFVWVLEGGFVNFVAEEILGMVVGIGVVVGRAVVEGGVVEGASVVVGIVSKVDAEIRWHFRSICQVVEENFEHF